jgi:hypothetical protein
MNKAEKIKEELVKTVGKGLYNGWHNRTSFGYHSYNIDDINIVGQRNPKMRLDAMKEYVDFKDKNVVDFGCNVGAMLHHLSEINSGFGFDYDNRCINAANNIANILERDDLEFHLHDFDKDGYSVLKSKIKEKPDIIFILALGSWVKTWKELYTTCIQYDCDIILETNNDDEGKPQLEFFRNSNMNIKMIIDNSKDDSTGNNRRKTYLINKK